MQARGLQLGEAAPSLDNEDEEWLRIDCGKEIGWALIQVFRGSGQCPWVSVGFRGFWSFSLGCRPAFVPSRPYFRVCVPVAEFLSTSLFPKRVALLAHQTTLHGRCSAARLVAVSPTRPVCQVFWHMRLRCHQHLSRAQAGRARLLDGRLPAFSPEEVAAADAADRVQ